MREGLKDVAKGAALIAGGTVMATDALQSAVNESSQFGDRYSFQDDQWINLATGEIFDYDPRGD